MLALALETRRVPSASGGLVPEHGDVDSVRECDGRVRVSSNRQKRPSEVDTLPRYASRSRCTRYALRAPVRSASDETTLPSDDDGDAKSYPIATKEASTGGDIVDERVPWYPKLRRALDRAVHAIPIATVNSTCSTHLVGRSSGSGLLGGGSLLGSSSSSRHFGYCLSGSLEVCKT
ncbi:hypothetical protein IE81DRAFT_44214 [Ceraceosorus guamensis]|uniref:Uncharacterized protein n=1 Tax=Ceraceosorus guamensis TaxID=1522189 RepID=A0A316W3D6_9BASI|nr:hypothetical protein IE81DRAFT_44214 [Ceraceosorus guamensis]PWN44024.1 hypothetical protein IE81DRAFT_44214 [Ceraceosorus guamensis]